MTVPEIPPVRSRHPGRAAVGARIVTTFERSARVKHHRPGMAHDIRIGIRQHFDVVAGR
jgi:hypothetical protein